MRRTLNVTSVKALPDYQLDLTFEDGSSGVAKLSDELTGPLAPLRDEALFRCAHVADSGGAVVWNDELDIAAEYLHALVNDLPPPTTEHDVLGSWISASMRELRQAAGKTQVEVAAAMGVAQGEISRLEQRSDTRLSTLDSFVRALGGELEVTVRLGGRVYRVGLPVGDADT